MGCKVTVFQANRVKCGGGHVVLHTVTCWALIRLGSILNCVVLVASNEGGGPHHLQGHHTRGIGIGVRRLPILT